MSEKYKIIKVASIYISIILGAGFASGQEINLFFVRYQKLGVVGLLLSGFLFFVVGYATLEICLKNNINNYNDFMIHVFGKRIGKLLENIVAIFLFIIFATMISGGGTALNEAFYINKNFAICIIAVLCFIVFLFDLNGIVEINTVLAPIMIVGAIFISLYSYFYNDQLVFLNSTGDVWDNWTVSSLIYSSYNIITVISILATMGNIVVNKKIAFYATFFSGLIMTGLGICLFLSLQKYQNIISGFEFPLLKITENYTVLIKYIYILVLLLAVFTTAISNGFAFIEWVSFKIKINKTLIKIIVVILATLASNVGFSNLVKGVYPIFGCIGILEVIVILWTFVYKKDK